MNVQANSEVVERSNAGISHSLKRGAMAGLPIMFGYLPIAITYGVLASEAGLNLFEITMMSVMVFAGASQFVATNMILTSVSAIEIILATFVLNFRHFVMSFSFMNQIRSFSLKWKIPLSMGLTDETFAVGSLHKKESKGSYGGWFYAAMILVSYSSWVGGSFLGGVLGEVIPTALSQSMAVALYAMFIALLVPSIRREWKIGIIAIISMGVNYILSALGVSNGWSIVVATLVGGASGIGLLKEEEA